MRLREAVCLAAIGLLGSFPAVADKPDWTYDEDYTGQEDWSAIRPEYAACNDGQAQSPVNIGETKIEKLPALKPQLGKATGLLRYADYTFTITLPGTHALKHDGTNYTLKSIRFHYPSEHIVRDVYTLFEVQMMYESAGGKRLALASMVNIGKENPAFAAMLAASNERETHATIAFNLADLLPQSLGYYAYSGSLTTPPCTENVQWRILKKPIEMSDAQRERLFSIIGRNGRLPQPLYFRKVLETAY